MNDRKPDGHKGKAGRTDRLGRDRRLKPIRKDWRWLDALSPADFDRGFLEAVEERSEDQQRPRLESLFD